MPEVRRDRGQIVIIRLGSSAPRRMISKLGLPRNFPGLGCCFDDDCPGAGCREAGPFGAYVLDNARLSWPALELVSNTALLAEIPEVAYGFKISRELVAQQLECE